MVHVLDASRGVGVVSRLLDPERRAELDPENARDQERLRDLHAEKERKPLLPLERGAGEPAPRRLRRPRRRRSSPAAACRARSRDAPRLHRLAVLLPRLGAEGQVPGDPRRAGGARALGRRPGLLDRIVARQAAHGARRLRLLAGARRGRRHRCRDDDALLFPPPAVRLRRLAPDRCSPTTSRPAGDHVGAFAVTAGIGADELAARFEAEHDDYNAIMVKALADRLAEAFAEYLHQRARRAWYEPAPSSRAEELIAEKYRGIRPAFGYPACPDHTREGEAVRRCSAPRRPGSRSPRRSR